MPQKIKRFYDYPSIYRQSIERFIPIKFEELTTIASTIDKIVVSDTTSIECHRFSPPAVTVLPTIFYLPGTGFAVRSVEVTRALCSNLAAKLNCHVIAIFHRVAIENKFPIPINDAIEVINHYLAHHNNYQIDNYKIILAGYSSGGLIAIQICLNAIKQQAMPFSELLLLAPHTNFADNPERIPAGPNSPIKHLVTSEFMAIAASEYLPNLSYKTHPFFSRML